MEILRHPKIPALGTPHISMENLGKNAQRVRSETPVRSGLFSEINFLLNFAGGTQCTGVKIRQIT